mgnify:CR=1 FL=1
MKESISTAIAQKAINSKSVKDSKEEIATCAKTS